MHIGSVFRRLLQQVFLRRAAQRARAVEACIPALQFVYRSLLQQGRPAHWSNQRGSTSVVVVVRSETPGRHEPVTGGRSRQQDLHWRGTRQRRVDQATRPEGLQQQFALRGVGGAVEGEPELEGLEARVDGLAADPARIEVAGGIHAHGRESDGDRVMPSRALHVLGQALVELSDIHALRGETAQARVALQEALVETIYRQIAQAFQDKELTEWVIRNGAMPAVSTPAEFKAFLRAEMVRCRATIAPLGIVVE
jgi:hypothetical protein